MVVEEASRIRLRQPTSSYDAPSAQPIWQALRERSRIHRLRLANPTSIRLIATYASAHRTLKQVSAAHKRQVREHKKSRIASAIREVSCSLTPSPRLSYQRLKTLAAWDPQPPICLRGRTSGATSCFCQTRTSVPLPPLNPTSPAKHIASIEPHKAVPEGSAPSSMYKLLLSWRTTFQDSFNNPRLFFPSRVRQPPLAGRAPCHAQQRQLIYVLCLNLESLLLVQSCSDP